jgi:hypothetical protein
MLTTGFQKDPTTPYTRIDAMNYRLKRLMLLAALPLCVAAMSQEAAAEDRFDVKIELLEFYSTVDAETHNDHPNVNYLYILHADISGAGRKSIVKKEVIGQPKQRLTIGRAIQFHNVRKPDRSSRLIKFSADATARYRTPSLNHKLKSMGKTRAATLRDIFDDADDSRDDKAVQQVVVKNQRYRFVLRVTVTEVD